MFKSCLVALFATLSILACGGSDDDSAETDYQAQWVGEWTADKLASELGASYFWITCRDDGSWSAVVGSGGVGIQLAGTYFVEKSTYKLVFPANEDLGLERTEDTGRWKREGDKLTLTSNDGTVEVWTRR